MSYIEEIFARQIIDSRGFPTIEVDVLLTDQTLGRAAVPSGASTGQFEAVELRDNDPLYYSGKGVSNAVDNVNNIISKEVIGLDAFDQRFIDRLLIEMDGTPNKANLGANSILAVSLAVAKAASASLDLPLYKYLGGAMANLLPVPMMNILNGGKHADTNVDFQEFMVLPVHADCMSESIRWGCEIFYHLKKVLLSKNLSTGVGDEGGFAPQLESQEMAFDLILEAIKNAGYEPGKDVYLGIDCAATEFYKDGFYTYKNSELGKKSSEEQVEYLADLCLKYPIISVEDGLDEEDWRGWQLLTEKIGNRVQLVGDDLFVTNTSRLARGIKDGAANSILVKVNQIGTLTETLEAVQLAHRNGYSSVMSHRSGETEDTTISHLAVAMGCGQIKTGAPNRTDRVAKYNELIRIAEELDEEECYAGSKAFHISL